MLKSKKFVKLNLPTILKFHLKTLKNSNLRQVDQYQISFCEVFQNFLYGILVVVQHNIKQNSQQKVNKYET
jgi:hypothetical protein